MISHFPLTRRLQVAEIPPEGVLVSVRTIARERRALADDLGILAILRLEARLEVSPWRRSGVRVVGELEADVEQRCVVTLDPVAQKVREPIDLTFRPAGDAPRQPVAGEVYDPLAADPPETFSGGVIDLGALVAEHLALALDPYPRKPGAVFEPLDETGESVPAGDSPFAVLSRLKDDDPSDSGTKT